MRTLGNIHETPWRTSKHVVNISYYHCVIPQSAFMGLPSDLEDDLHFLSIQKWRRNSRWPRTLEIVYKDPVIGVFSQHVNFLCVLQTGKPSGAGWWRQGRMDMRTLPLWPVFPLAPLRSWIVLPTSQWRCRTVNLYLTNMHTLSWERNHWGI